MATDNFNPAEYLASGASADTFNPAEYLGTPSAPVEQPKPSGLANYTSVLSRPLLEGGGATVGSLMGGGPETPIGLAGGVAGFGLGKAAADLLDTKLGIKKPLENVGQAALETGDDILQGMNAESAGKLLAPVLRGAGKGALKLASSYIGVPESAVLARLADPQVISSSSFPQTAVDLADTANNLKGSLKNLDDETWGSLLKLKAESKSSILGMLNKVKGDLTVSGTGQTIGQSKTAAHKALDEIYDQIKSLNTPSYAQKLSLPPGLNSGEAGQFLDQNQLKQILDSVRDDVDFSNPSASVKNQSLLNFTHYLSDYLKQQNPQYADRIQQSADRASLLHNLESTFSLGKINGSYEPTDATAAKIKGLLKENKLKTQGVSDQLKSLTGMDLNQLAQNATHAESFENARANGSRRVNLFGMMGAGLGSLVGNSTAGAVGGSMVGGALDTSGPQMLGKVLDFANRLGLTGLPTIPPNAMLGLSATALGQRNR